MTNPGTHAKHVLIDAIACLLPRGQGLWTYQGGEAMFVGDVYRESKEIIIDRMP